MPKISVVVPIYNTRERLLTCLTSLRRQSLPDIEIICVDDASSDGSADIIKELSGHDQRVKLIQHKENKGPGAARNTGIKASSAPYLLSVDSDDFIDERALEHLWEIAHVSDIDVVIFGFRRLDEDGNEVFISSPKPRTRTRKDGINFLKGSPIFCNKMWRRELLVENNIFFPSRRYHEDVATTPRGMYFANSVQYIPEILYNYKERQSSITAQITDRNVVDLFIALDIVHNFLEEEGISGLYAREFQRFIDRNFTYMQKLIENSQVSQQEKKVLMRLCRVTRSGMTQHYFSKLPGWLRKMGAVRQRRRGSSSRIRMK